MTINNALLNLDRNLRFVGLLDSAKTAHPIPSPTEINNWWMPADVDTHLLHCAAAEAMTIKQVLWGEIPQLPRNQSFDSPAWLKLADYFVKSELPLFSICVLGKSATPEAFVEDCAQQFKPTSPFALSAWPDLTDDQRKIIAENISKQGNFKRMFDKMTLDSRWKTTFQFQQDILQRMLEYLKTHYKLEPQLIRAVDFAPTTTWDRIERDYKDPQFISNMRDKHGDDLASSFQTAFKEINAKAIRDIGDDPKNRDRWLSTRTNLYKEIHHEPRELREILRAEIDRCYVETTSESVTGVGRFCDHDRSDTERPIDKRFYDSLLEDMGNDPAGLQEYHVIDFDNLEFEQKSITDFLDAIRNKGISERLRELRRIRAFGEYPPRFVEEFEEKHLNELCKEFPNIIIRREQRPFRIAWKVGKLVVNVTIGYIVGQVTDFMKEIVQEITNEAISEAKGEALGALNIEQKVSNLISKKHKEALSGILRDWLTKRIIAEDKEPE